MLFVWFVCSIYFFTIYNTVQLHMLSRLRVALRGRCLSTAVVRPDLRDYQRDCVSSIINELSLGKYKSLAVSIGTGGGKTVTFSSLIPELIKIPHNAREKQHVHRNGVLILVHRTELASQTIATLQRLGLKNIYLDMSKSRPDFDQIEANPTEPFIIVGSVPSLARMGLKRMDQYPLDRFHSIIIDECHHSAAESYQNIISKFKNTFILGFTATLSRNDRKPLGKTFAKIVYEKPIHELIDGNYLVDFKWQKVNVGLNLDEIESNSKDYLLDSLAQHVVTEEIHQIILKTFLKLQSKQNEMMNSVLGFCVNVEHMQILSKLFNANDIPSNYISGQTNPNDRASILEDFKSGKLKVLFNCGVFTEGTDIPNIDTILLIRPTKSKELLTQMIGRGLRLHHSKTFLHIIDFVDNQSLGLSFKGQLLKEKPQSMLQLAGSTDGKGGPPIRDMQLPGTAEYIKMSGSKTILDMLNESNVNHYRLIKSDIDKLNSHLGIQFDLLAYNTYVFILHPYQYFQLKVSKGPKYTLEVVRKFDRGIGENRKISRLTENLVTNGTIDEIISQMQKLSQSDVFKESLNKQMNSMFQMRGKQITEKQSQYLIKKMSTLIQNQARPILNVSAAISKARTCVTQMDREQASRLISFSTISKSSLELWLQRNLFNTNAKRKAVTSQDYIDSMNRKMETGWDE